MCNGYVCTQLDEWNNITNNFIEVVNECNLNNIGFIDNNFTWTNNQEGSKLIQAILDIILISNKMMETYFNISNNHLTKYSSDHNPMLLTLNSFPGHKNNFGQRSNICKFEKIWITKDESDDIVKHYWKNSKDNQIIKLKNTLTHLSIWGKRKFEHLFVAVKKSHKNITHMRNRGPILKITKIIEVKKPLDQTYWSQTDKGSWLAEGDKNAKYIHLTSNQRRKKNTISQTEGVDRNIYKEESNMFNIFIGHFSNIFTSNKNIDCNEIYKVVAN